VRKLQRQSDVDRRNSVQMEERAQDLERQNLELQRTLRYKEEESKESKRKVESLEEQLSKLQQRLSLGSGFVAEADAAFMVAPGGNSQDTEGAEPRRRLFSSVANASYSPALEKAICGGVRTSSMAHEQVDSAGRGRSAVSHGASPPLPRHDKASLAAVPRSDAAVIRTSSVGSNRPAEEEPPQGCVQKLRKSFESRSSTPSRLTGNRNLRHHDEGGAMPSSGPQQASSARARAGNPSNISTVRVPATDTEDVDFGMSPIRMTAQVSQRIRSLQGQLGHVHTEK